VIVLLASDDKRTWAQETRFVTMHESPYHGLNFCQGTIAEMLDDPAREIFAVIRWFGERGKIFNVHFRNIKGISSTSWKRSPTKATWTWRARSPLHEGRGRPRKRHDRITSTHVTIYAHAENQGERRRF
jgi:hypothetical protein